MSVAAQAVEGSVATGAIYSLVGSGFALLFRASKVLSFCQGGFMLVGAFVFYDAVSAWKLGFLAALCVSAVILTVLSAGTYFVVFARVASRAAFGTSVTTIGLAGVLQAAVAVKFGTSPLQVPSVLSSRGYHVLGAVVPVVDIVTVATAAVVLAVLLVVVRLTPLGRRMEAVADNAGLAEHLGLSAARTSTLAWGIAGASTAVAGSVFAIRSAVDPVGVSNVALLAFPAIILGGLDSVGGAAIGGLLFAGVQNFVEVALGSGWVTIVSFALMLALLAVRPSGMFGRPDVVRL